MNQELYQKYRSSLMRIMLSESRLDELSLEFLTHMISYPNKMTYDSLNNHWYPIYDPITAAKAEELVAEKTLLGCET